MKIAIIGNSHVAAWKLAWDEKSNELNGSFEIVFFASRGANLLKMGLDSDCLVPTDEDVAADLKHTSKGEVCIDPSEFDLFLVVGLFPFEIFEIDKPWYSKSLSEAMISDFVKGRGAFRLVTLLRAITLKPIFLVHEPLPALPIDESLFERCPYLDLIRSVNRDVFGRIGVELLPQPKETILRGLRTKPIYSRGSESLDVGDELSGIRHDDREFLHMNKNYGAISLNHFLSVLSNV